MTREEIGDLITERIVLFHDALLSSGQIPLPPAEMSPREIAGIDGNAKEEFAED